jgi:hypothetical protein
MTRTESEFPKDGLIEHLAKPLAHRIPSLSGRLNAVAFRLFHHYRDKWDPFGKLVRHSRLDCLYTISGHDSSLRIGEFESELLRGIGPMVRG